MVELTAYWGNDDAESTLSISSADWARILDGEEFSGTTLSWYEGKRFNVHWSFSNGKFSISGDDGEDWVIESPLSELIVNGA